jgi:hypothetical protein
MLRGAQDPAQHVRAATPGEPLHGGHLESASAFVTLTDDTTIALDWDAGTNFDVTLTANRTTKGSQDAIARFLLAGCCRLDYPSTVSIALGHLLTSVARCCFERGL